MARPQIKRFCWLTLLSLLLFGCGETASLQLPGQLFPWPTEPPQSDSLSLGVAPSRDAARLIPWFERLARYIQHCTRPDPEADSGGLVLRVELANSYHDLLDGLASGRYDLGFATPLAYVRLLEDPRLRGAEILATSVMDVGTTYRSYLVVQQDAPYEQLLDLEGATLVAPDPLSISGYVFPRACAARLRFHPDHFFGEVRFVGNHDSVLAVLRREPGLVAGISSTLFGFDSSIAQQGLKVLAKSNPIPTDPLIAGPGVPHADREWIRAALLNLDDDDLIDGSSLLRGDPGIQGWVPPEPRDFEELLRLADPMEYHQAGAED